MKKWFIACLSALLLAGCFSGSYQEVDMPDAEGRAICARAHIATTNYISTYKFDSGIHDVSHCSMTFRCLEFVSDSNVVAKAEADFLAYYQNLPAKEASWLANELVTFGTEATYAVMKQQLKEAPLGVRVALVDALLDQWWVTVPFAKKRLCSPTPKSAFPDVGYVENTIPSGGHPSHDEIAGLLAFSLLCDNVPYTTSWVETKAITLFLIPSKGEYTQTLSECIAKEIIASGVSHPELDKSLAKIRENSNHPTQKTLQKADAAGPIQVNERMLLLLEDFGAEALIGIEGDG